MLTNFFGKSNPINFVVIVGLFLCYFFITIFQQPFKSILTINFLITQSSILILILGLFFLYNSIVLKNHLTFHNTYAFLFFVIGLGLFPNTITNLKIGLINFGLFLFLQKVYSLKSSKLVFQKLFDSGFILGIIFMFEPSPVVFGLLLYASIYLHQKITFQTLLIPLLGFFIPLFLYFIYCFWVDKTLNFEQLFYRSISYHFYVYKNTRHLISIVMIGLFTGFFLLIKTKKTLTISSSFRRNWTLIILNLCIAISLLFLTKTQTNREWLYVLFPASIILANGIELIEKKWMKEVILILYLGYSFVSILKFNCQVLV